MLDRGQAAARFGAAATIEFLSLIVCFIPLLKFNHGWHWDCFWVGLVTLILFLIVCFIVYITDSLKAFNGDKRFYNATEIGIATIFVLNLICLSLVILRTGGPIASLYSPLIPLQLTGILFLQFHKDKLKGKFSKFGLIYVVLSAIALLLTYTFHDPASGLFFISPDISGPDFDSSNKMWHMALTTAGMILAFILYWLPQENRFIIWFKSRYSSKKVY